MQHHNALFLISKTAHKVKRNKTQTMRNYKQVIMSFLNNTALHRALAQTNEKPFNNIRLQKPLSTVGFVSTFINKQSD